MTWQDQTTLLIMVPLLILWFTSAFFCARYGIKRGYPAWAAIALAWILNFYSLIFFKFLPRKKAGKSNDSK
ncbi:MAG: hypothetical protein EBR26_04050 [Microbacteriaceae bacterium]|nr:hypothetical protein [Microbacteriaceae bacterium]